jgi:primosomal protein N' (replication factor Y)
LCDNTLTAIGSGTERIEEYLESIFNKTTIVRVDRDSARKKYFMKDMNEKISQGGPCILIGTQMLAKGHDFKHITSVFVLDTDAELFHPDFKSQERLGQLLTQVAGRGGRGISSSEIFLQTYYPNHPLLEKLTNGNYKEFLQEIGKEREITSMPPFSFVTLIRANSVNEKNVVDFLDLVKKMVERVEPQSPQNQYLGPIPSMLEKRAGRYRYNFQIKTHTRSKMHILLTKLIEQLSKTKSFSNVRWSIDVDPIEL